MPCGSGITHTSSVSDTEVRSELGADVAQSQDSLREDPDVAQDPQASSGHRVSFASSGPEIHGAREPEDDEEDDRDSFYEPQAVDKTLNRLFHYVYDKFLESRPLSDSLAPPLCEFESFISVAEPQSAARLRLCIYPRVNELVADTSERASKLACESKLLSRIIPLRRNVFPVADQPDYSSPRFLNPDFARISNKKNIAKSKRCVATFADLEKIERAALTLVAGQLHSYWLLSALLVQLKQDGFKPSDPALFDKNTSALSASFATQTSVCAEISEFVTAKRCESFLAHASFPVLEPQKRSSWSLRVQIFFCLINRCWRRS